MSSSQIHFPDFLFVGTAKAGTTSIYNYLVQHPDIVIPKKETFYFIRDAYPEKLLPYPKQRKEQDLFRDISELEKLYSGIDKGKLVGEVGTGYLYFHEKAIPEILKLTGSSTKILIILRNPIERTFSSFMHFKKYSFELENLKREIKKENERKTKGFDFMWQFSGLSYYAESVLAYKKAFKEVKVLFYEDLKKDPNKFMDEIISFLGVSKEFEFDTSKSFNPSGKPKNERLQKMITGDYFLKRKLRPIYHAILGKKRVQEIRDNIRDKNLSRISMNSEDKAFLSQLFREDINELQEILGDKVNLYEKWNLDHI